jgi:hypothetical protein
MVLYSEFIKIKTKHGECLLSKGGNGKIYGKLRISEGLRALFKKKLKKLKIDLKIISIKHGTPGRLIHKAIDLYESRSGSTDQSKTDKHVLTHVVSGNFKIVIENNF